MRHFSFLNIFLFAAPFLLQLLLTDLLTGEGVGVESNPNVYIKNAPPPSLNSHWSLPVTGEGVGWSPERKHGVLLLIIVKKSAKKLYTSPRGKQTCMG